MPTCLRQSITRKLLLSAAMAARKPRAAYTLPIERDIHAGERIAFVDELPLRNVSEPDSCILAHLPGQRLQYPKHRLEYGGLPRAVGTDSPGKIPLRSSS